MDNPIKKAYDIASIEKDINERQQIIDTYISTGYLDRNEAVSKIKNLRESDKTVATVTAVKLTQYSVPFSEVPDENIVAELQMQVDILMAELAKKTADQ